jgi:hypothetical protein
MLSITSVMLSLKELEEARNAAKVKYNIASKKASNAFKVVRNASLAAKTSNESKTVAAAANAAVKLSKNHTSALEEYMKAQKTVARAKHKGGSRKMKRRGRSTRRR